MFHKKSILPMILLYFVFLISTATAMADERDVDPAAATKYYQTESKLVKVGQWGSYEKADGKLYTVRDVAVAQDGTLFISQHDGTDMFSRVQHFCEDGKFLGWFGGMASGVMKDEYLYRAGAVTCSPDYSVFVTQDLMNRVSRFTYKGKFKSVWYGYSAYYATPLSITNFHNGDVLYVDRINSMVHHYTNRGKHLWTYPDQKATATAETFYAAGAAVDSNGDVYVTDHENRKVHVLNKKGKKIREWGKFGRTPELFTAPRKILFGPGGYLYIHERRGDRDDVNRGKIYLKQYTKQGTLVCISELDRHSTDLDFLYDMYQAFSIGPDGTVFVVETNKPHNFARVVKYQHKPFKAAGAKGRLKGKVTGFAKDELVYLSIRYEGELNGVKFFGTLRPNSSGKYKFTRLPVGIPFTLKLVGYDTTKYKCTPINGVSEIKMAKQNLVLKKK